MKRTQILLIVCGAGLALAACGFHPLYGKIGAGPGAQAVFSSVYVAPIELEKAGYELRNDLIDQLQAKSEPAGASYDLRIVARDRNQAIAIQNEHVGNLKEVEITRYNYTLIANYELVERKTQKVLTKGSESSLSAYDVVANPYATQVAKEDAQSRSAQDIADQLRIRIAVYLAQHDGHPQ
ncbi:MAG TPA: LPS assembly lipoprotein LptE [Rhizomicrobium sp.]